MERDGERLFLHMGPFETLEEHWQYVEHLADHLHGGLQSLGVPYFGQSPEAELIRAANAFLQCRSALYSSYKKKR